MKFSKLCFGNIVSYIAIIKRLVIVILFVFQVFDVVLNGDLTIASDLVKF